MLVLKRLKIGSDGIFMIAVREPRELAQRPQAAFAHQALHRLWLPKTPNAPESLEFWDSPALMFPAPHARAFDSFCGNYG